MESCRDPIDRIQAVLRAQSTADPFDDLAAHLSAVASGAEILPVIRTNVLNADWSVPKPIGRLRALTALMLVAHDADEVASRELAQELASRDEVHPVFRQRLASISRFTLDDYHDREICGLYHDREICGLRVLIEKCLGDFERTSAYLLDWLSGLPPVDLAGISRIYIIERATESYWGEYLRILSKIALVWRGGSEQSIRDRLATEFTLYHEVGHHVDRSASHSREECERAADSYALRQFSLAHPILGSGALSMIALTLILGRTPRVRL